MATHIITSRTQRPGAPVTAINFHSPQMVRLRNWWPLNDASDTLYRDLIGGNNITPPTGLITEPFGMQGGYAVKGDGASAATLNSNLGGVRWTITCWFYVPSGMAGSGRVFGNQSTSTSLGFQPTGQYLIRFPGYAGPQSYGSFPLDRWNHCAIIHNGSLNCELYTNGFPDETPAADGTGNAPFNRLFGAPGVSDYFGGWVHDIRQYDFELSPAEVYHQFDPITRWDLYYPLARKLWSFPHSSAAQNATPEAATVTITCIDPAVAGSSTATATPNPVTVTTTGVDPSASGSGTITGNPDASSVTVVASDPSATPSGSAPTSPEVASITITGVDPAAAGSGSSAATPDAASINVSSIAPQASGVGTSTATPDISSTTVSAIDTSASGSGTGTAVPDAATVTVSAVDAAASFVGAGTGTADVATVTISTVAVTATPGPVTIIPDVATSTTSTADAAATAIGTATANPDFGLVSAAAANSAGSGFGITTFTPAVATIVVTSSDAAGTPSGSVAASPDVATATVTALDCAVAATGAATASPDAATVTVFSQSASAEGGIVVLGPFYVDAAQTLMAGPDVCQALTAGAEEWQSVTAGTGVGQMGVP